jgi:hypothetical protein
VNSDLWLGPYSSTLSGGFKLEHRPVGLDLKPKLFDANFYHNEERNILEKERNILEKERNILEKLEFTFRST